MASGRTRTVKHQLSTAAKLLAPPAAPTASKRQKARRAKKARKSAARAPAPDAEAADAALAGYWRASVTGKAAAVAKAAAVKALGL